MPETLPETGIASRSMRLTYPACFPTEKAARRFVDDNNLWQAGVTVAEVPDDRRPWRIVIDSLRAPMLAPWLRTQYPGILWSVGWTP
jgi:hypothetical protein